MTHVLILLCQVAAIWLMTHPPSHARLAWRDNGTVWTRDVIVVPLPGRTWRICSPPRKLSCHAQH